MNKTSFHKSKGWRKKLEGGMLSKNGNLINMRIERMIVLFRTLPNYGGVY